MGVYINGVKMGKPYINGVKHNAYINGQKIWNDSSIPPHPPVAEGEFMFYVEDGGTFDIPVSGVNGSSSTYQSYSWIIDWGDGNTQTVSGTGSNNANIPHTYTDGKQGHFITIKPNGTATQGWFNAFGSSAYQNRPNLAKIKELNSPITSLMRTMNRFSHSNIFLNCDGLTTIPENLLPATTLAEYCYQTIFANCTGLTTIPENLLPATTLAKHCYYQMFNTCTRLTTIPENLLPATTLAESCYLGMFSRSAGLTTIPENLLPATTLAKHCYYQMFSTCTRLTTIPENLLPATTLADRCYRSMFKGCANLTDIGSINAAWFSGKLAQASMFTNDTKITTPITYADIPTEWK
jgi:hypothetical protein